MSAIANGVKYIGHRLGSPWSVAISLLIMRQAGSYHAPITFYIRRIRLVFEVIEPLLFVDAV